MILNGIFLVVYVAFVAAKSVDTKQFRCDYKYSPDAGGWLKLHEEPVDWETARLTCQFEGGILASPINEELKKSMTTLMDPADKLKCNSVFTGIHSLYSFEGVHLSKIPHEWADREPDNYNNEENCISMETTGKLADINCNETLPFICYKKFTKKLIMTQCGTTDYEYSMDVRTGSCYKFHRNPRSWSMARMTCEAEGGQLAIINDDMEAQVIKEIFAKYPQDTILGKSWKDKAFIGYRGWSNNEDLFTVEGQTLQEAGYAKFHPGEPDYPTETIPYCGAVTRDGLLYVIQCQSKCPFVCEKSPDSILCDS